MESEDEDDEEQAREMPQEFLLGTPQAWEYGYQNLYRQQKINGETVFICAEKSSSGRATEFVLMRRLSGVWIAYNGSINGNALTLRNAIFRCKADITAVGAHMCEINETATPSQERDHCIWSKGICFLTKLNTMVTNREAFNEEIQ